MGMFHYYDIGISELFVFDEFLINQIREGESVEPEHNQVLEEVIQKHFAETPLVYITNRVNSYAVNPLTYLGTVKIKNLSAFAVVASSEMQRDGAKFEKQFYNKPFEIFETLGDAIQWANSILKELSK